MNAFLQLESIKMNERWKKKIINILIIIINVYLNKWFNTQIQ